jgi:hypothetical protein
MKVVCDTCGRVGNASKTDLMAEGWRRVVLTSPLRKTFTGCPDHARIAAEAAIAAIEGHRDD